MSSREALQGVLLALVALYGLGVPFAWFLPAPKHSRWVLRIAIAPLLSIAVSALLAVFLTWLGLPLHPGILLALLVGAWLAAIARYRHIWNLASAIRHAAAPGLMVGLSVAIWTLSLIGYGLYLPNEDFKNHAYFVAQVAWTRSVDPSLILRPAPISAPDLANFYPLGLHGLLGWALPSATSPSVAITSAAAVLVTSVSMPLALVALARMWNAESQPLTWLAGLAGIAFVGLSNGFAIGSVVLLIATGLYAASLAVMWQWLRGPTIGTTTALLLCWIGLLALHVAEALGLALLALVCLPMLNWAGIRGLTGRRLAPLSLVIVAAAAASVLMITRLLPLLQGDLVWDLQPNSLDPVTAVIVAAGQQPGGDGWVRAGWIVAAVGGFWMAVRRGWGSFPLVALIVPVGVGTIAGMDLAPDWLNLLTAPWYGSAARAGLMAAGPVAMAAAALMAIALAAAGGARHQRTIGTAAGGVALLALGALVVQIVPDRRESLALHLAGAGDTETVARLVAEDLKPGESVLNFQGDGTANLFAFARVPVTAGLSQDPAVSDGPEPLIDQLLRLDEPGVRARLEQLRIAMVAIGIRSRYWGEETSYAVDSLVAQRQLRVVHRGTDVVVLRYETEAGP